MMSGSTAHIAINYFAVIHPLAFNQLYKYTHIQESNEPIHMHTRLISTTH